MIFFNKSNLSKVFKIITAPLVKKAKLKQKPNLKAKHCINLHNNLKQLEFISCFEMHLDKRKEDSYSQNFLQELAEIKHKAEINTLESIKHFKN